MQGVHEFGEDGIVSRVKVTTKPGGAFGGGAGNSRQGVTNVKEARPGDAIQENQPAIGRS